METKTNNETIKVADIAASISRSLFTMSTAGSIFVNRIQSTPIGGQFWSDRYEWWKKQLRAVDPNINIDFQKVANWEQALTYVAASILSDRTVSLGRTNDDMPIFTSASLTGTNDKLHAKATTVSKQYWARITGLQIDTTLWNLMLNIIRPVRPDAKGDIYINLYLDTSTNWETSINNIILSSAYKDEYERAISVIKRDLHTIEIKDADLPIGNDYMIVDDNVFTQSLMACIVRADGAANAFYKGVLPKIALQTEDMGLAIMGWFRKLAFDEATGTHMSMYMPYNGGVTTAEHTNFVVTNRQTISLPESYAWNANVLPSLNYVIASDATLNNNTNLWQFGHYSLNESALDPYSSDDVLMVDQWLFTKGCTLYGKSNTTNPSMDREQFRSNSNSSNRSRNKSKNGGYNKPYFKPGNKGKRSSSNKGGKGTFDDAKSGGSKGGKPNGKSNRKETSNSDS